MAQSAAAEKATHSSPGASGDSGQRSSDAASCSEPSGGGDSRESGGFNSLSLPSHSEGNMEWKCYRRKGKLISFVNICLDTCIWYSLSHFFL